MNTAMESEYPSPFIFSLYNHLTSPRSEVISNAIEKNLQTCTGSNDASGIIQDSEDKHVGNLKLHECPFHLMVLTYWWKALYDHEYNLPFCRKEIKKYTYIVYH